MRRTLRVRLQSLLLTSPDGTGEQHCGQLIQQIEGVVLGRGF
jgi:hypothetical protein